MGKDKAPKPAKATEGDVKIPAITACADHTQDRSQRFQSQLLKGDAETRTVYANVNIPFTVVYRDGKPVAARLAPGITALFPEDEAFNDICG